MMVEIMVDRNWIRNKNQIQIMSTCSNRKATSYYTDVNCHSVDRIHWLIYLLLRFPWEPLSKLWKHIILSPTFVYLFLEHILAFGHSFSFSLYKQFTCGTHEWHLFKPAQHIVFLTFCFCISFLGFITLLFLSFSLVSFRCWLQKHI